MWKFHLDRQFILFVFILFICCSCENTLFDDPLDSHNTLNVPINLKLDSLTETSAKLSWIDPNYNPDYPDAQPDIEIEESSDGVNFKLVKVASGNSATIIDTFFIKKIYLFRLRAKTGSKTSDYSNRVNGTLSFPPPTHIIVSSFFNDSMTITWQNNCTFETGFEVYMGVDSSNLSLVKTEPANSVTSTISGSFSSRIA
jgi:hypothetical protein